jgi:hypothetical protein
MIKKILIIFIKISLSSSIIFMLSGCESSNENTFTENIFSVDELYDYCNIAQSQCGETLACDGESILAYGTVLDLNTVPSENRFMLYNENKNATSISDVMSASSSLEINTISNSDAIFQKLESIMDGDFKKNIQLNAKIHIIDLPINGDCIQGIALDLTSAENLSLRD